MGRFVAVQSQSVSPSRPSLLPSPLSRTPPHHPRIPNNLPAVSLSPSQPKPFEGSCGGRARPSGPWAPASGTPASTPPSPPFFDPGPSSSEELFHTSGLTLSTAFLSSRGVQKRPSQLSPSPPPKVCLFSCPCRGGCSQLYGGVGTRNLIVWMPFSAHGIFQFRRRGCLQYRHCLTITPEESDKGRYRKV